MPERLALHLPEVMRSSRAPGVCGPHRPRPLRRPPRSCTLPNAITRAVRPEGRPLSLVRRAGWRDRHTRGRVSAAPVRPNTRLPRRARFVRAMLEVLEDRLALTTFTMTSPTAAGLLP